MLRGYQWDDMRMHHACYREAMTAGKTVTEIFRQIPENLVSQQQPVIDDAACETNLHVHLPPNFGSIPSVEDVLARAAEERIVVLGASNYYDHAIYTPFAYAAVQAGVVPVFGVEVLTMDHDLRQTGILTNDPKNPGKLYLCGKGLTNFDAFDDGGQQIWKRIREGDAQRIEEMIAKINGIPLLQQHGIRLQYEAIAREIAEEKGVPVETVFLQERHLARAIQQAIFTTISAPERETFLQQLYQHEGEVNVEDVVAVQNEARTYLLKQGKAAYADERFVSPKEAAQLILDLGGYVSYPILADGASPISAFEGPPEELAERLLERQIGAAELIPARNTPETLTAYVTTLRNQGIVLGAGTEHNNAVWIPLTPACKGNTAIPAPLRAIFWEGACVAVAHQYLRAKGREGFRFFATAAERIEQIRDLSSLGAKVIGAIREL